MTQTIYNDCYRCGYDIRGIADDQPCPECGLLAQRSRRPTEELYDTRPEWLRGISWGANLILIALVLGVAMPIAGQWMADRVWHLGWTARPYLMYFCVGFPAALFVWAIFMLTRREGHAPADRASRALRMLVRAAILAAALALIVLIVGSEIQNRMLIHARFSAAPDLPDWFWLCDLILGMAGLIPFPLLLFFRLRALARRARIAELMEYSAIVGIGSTATIVYMVLRVVGSVNMRPDSAPRPWYQKPDTAFVLIAIGATAAALFGLWGFFLFIYFAVAFRSAMKKMRSQWARDDRSAVV